MKTKAMTKTTSGGEAEHKSHMRECIPCDFPPFCRNNYYTGKLLTERDLTAEQRYLIDKMRLHYLALHGWGVVCGLKVRPHPYCPDLRLIVEPGLAIDGCGREIWLRKEIEITLPKAPEAPPKESEPCPPEPGHPDPKQQGSPYEERQDQTQESPSAPCLPAENLYICVRYAECETEFSPAPFDECACNGNAERPNRVCETYKVEWELLTEEPKDWDKIRKTKSECEVDCEDLYKTMSEACPQPGWPECIPLAVIPTYTPGQIVTEDMIDNGTYRPLLPSTRLLDQLIRCILGKIPAKELTCIEDIGWTHNQEYHCHDFMRMFTGSGEPHKGLEVTFSARVNHDGLSTRSFQALAVRRPEKGKGGSHLEVVPATVSWLDLEEKTKSFLLIDRAYAERCLDGVNFDLYITLRCDLIVDLKGCPVDGNLLARLQSDDTYVAAPPTGDGIPGGRFESWIRVRA